MAPLSYVICQMSYVMIMPLTYHFTTIPEPKDYTPFPEDFGVNYWMERCHAQAHLAVGCSMASEKGAAVSKKRLKCCSVLLATTRIKRKDAPFHYLIKTIKTNFS